MQQLQVFTSAILAGICISLGGWVFLALSGNAGLGAFGPVIGSILFTFGLLTVVHYKYKLYTGALGFIKAAKGDVADLLLILLGNILGCLLVSLLARLSPLPLQETAQKLLEGRLACGALRCGALAIGCGFIMTAAVYNGRQGKFLPLLFGVPLFIMCGFPHCIADAFYYLAAPCDFLGANAGAVLALYACIVVGNFIGGNLYRWILIGKQE